MGRSPPTTGLAEDKLIPIRSVYIFMYVYMYKYVRVTSRGGQAPPSYTNTLEIASITLYLSHIYLKTATLQKKIGP